MRINYILAILFLAFVSIVVIANIDESMLINCTELNGSGCVCHTTERDTLVKVWVEGPETLLVGQTGLYKMFMTGGPAEAGGYNVAGRLGEMVLVDTFSTQNSLAMNELTQAFSLPFPTSQDTIYWAFGYKALEALSEWDTIYSCGLSIVWDLIPDSLDRWNFGPKFPVRILSVTDLQESPEQPDDFILYQNYPNPFNPTTVISYQLPVTSNVILKVYDVLGNEVQTIVNEYQTAGRYEIIFKASEITSGIYYYRLESGNLSEIKKMVVIK